jgi:hypothetical protein
MDLNFNFDGHLKAQDALIRTNFDAGTSPIVGRLLRHTMAEVMEYKYTPTRWANEEIITFDRSIPVGAESVDWHMKSDVAPADDGWLAANAPIPFSDIAVEQHNNRVVGRLDGFQFDIGEVEKYAFTGMGSIATDKGSACKRNWLNRMNTAILSGLAGKFTGVLNEPSASQLICGTTANCTADWIGTATPDQIVTTIETVYQTIHNRTSGNIEPDTVVMPSNLKGVMRRQKSLVDGTIGEWIKRQFTEITQWSFDPRLNTAGIGGTSALVMLPRGREYISGLLPQAMKPMPVYIKHGTTEQGFRSAFAGLKVPYSGSVAVLSNAS